MTSNQKLAHQRSDALKIQRFQKFQFPNCVYWKKMGDWVANFFFLIYLCLRWAPYFASRSLVCFLFVLRTYFECFVWRLCCVICCSVPKASLVALLPKPSQTKALQDTPFEVCKIFFFFTACPWQQHLGTWITSPTVSVAEVIRFPDAAWAKTSFVILIGAYVWILNAQVQT